MIMHPIGRGELLQVQLAFLAAIGMQLTLNDDLAVGPHVAIAIFEVLLLIAVSITAPTRHNTSTHIHKFLALLLIGIVSLINTVSLILVIGALLNGASVAGAELLLSALAIYATNVIVFSIWYWEIDSPGLTGLRRKSNEMDFIFNQQRMNTPGAKSWKPTYFDYLYLSFTNATNFAPAETKPLSHTAKGLMMTQVIISLFTLALVAARAISTLT